MKLYIESLVKRRLKDDKVIEKLSSHDHKKNSYHPKNVSLHNQYDQNWFKCEESTTYLPQRRYSFHNVTQVCKKKRHHVQKNDTCCKKNDTPQIKKNLVYFCLNNINFKM